jgi:hypothetical protein
MVCQIEYASSINNVKTFSSDFITKRGSGFLYCPAACNGGSHLNYFIPAKYLNRVAGILFPLSNPLIRSKQERVVTI